MRSAALGALLAGVLVAGCSSSGGSSGVTVGEPRSSGSPAAVGSPRPSAAALATGAGSPAAVATGRTAPMTAGSAPSAARACPSAARPPVTAAGSGTPVSYTGTGTGSYTAPDGTGATYPFPPRWTYVWRATERLVELSATDALGTWGVAASSDDERLSKLSAVFLTAPDGRGGSVTFSLQLAAPLAFTALAPGATVSGRAADESLVVSVHRPSSAASFVISMRAGRCPATEGIGAGSLTVSLDGAAPPWGGITFAFNVRLEDDVLKGNLQLRRT